LLVRYESGGFTYIRPLREIDQDQAIELIITLQTAWIDSSQNTKAIVSEFWQIVKAICLMIPTVTGLEWDFEKLKTDYTLLESLFLHPECTFLKLHEFEPRQREHKDLTTDESLPLIPENLPFPSGGNTKADRIASYLYGTDWGPGQVKELFQWLSREELSSLIWSLSELGNPDRRIDEIKQSIAEEYGEIPFDMLSDFADQTFENDGVSDEMHAGI
jgi:hypothetical protein